MDIKGHLASELNRDLKYQEWFEGTDQPIHCHVCYEVVSGPAYIYKDNYGYRLFALHKGCAESPCKIQHPLHPDHPLEADCNSLEFFGAIIKGFICKECRYYSFGFSYGCSSCNFKLDFRCVSNQQNQLPLGGKMETKADFHDHKLQRFFHNKLLSSYVDFFEDIICSFCSTGFDRSAFACIECGLFIHESCILKVPHGKQIKSPFHLEHPLVLQLADFNHRCRACRGPIRHGDLFLDCLECRTPLDSLHISCASITTSGLRLEQYHNDHPMLCVYSVSGLYFQSRTCVVCNTNCDYCYIYGCLVCGVFVHTECIPLPGIVKHESHSYDDHSLTFSDQKKLHGFASNEYHCFICEEKGNLNHPFYHCEDCNDVAHIDCVLNEVSL